MIKSRVYVAGALLAAAGAAHAGISVTPAIVSDYDFRGISQTAKDPALQLGLNWAAEGGFYAGLWGSNVDFGPGVDADVEVDAFAGFTGGDAAESFGYDVGAIYYSYISESDLNFPELYAGISKGPFAAKLWYSWDFGGVGEEAWYIEGNGTFPLGDNGFALLAHAGYSTGSYWSDLDAEYFDWSVGVSKSWRNFTFALKYIDGSDLEDGGTDVFSTDDKVWASVSTTLPWASE